MSKSVLVSPVQELISWDLNCWEYFADNEYNVNNTIDYKSNVRKMLISTYCHLGLPYMHCVDYEYNINNTITFKIHVLKMLKPEPKIHVLKMLISTWWPVSKELLFFYSFYVLLLFIFRWILKWCRFKVLKLYIEEMFTK